MTGWRWNCLNNKKEAIKKKILKKEKKIIINKWKCKNFIKFFLKQKKKINIKLKPPENKALILKSGPGKQKSF